MDLAAVVVVPSNEAISAIEESRTHAAGVSNDSRPLHSSREPILGNDVLKSWMERIRKIGVRTAWLTSRPSEASVLSDLARFAGQGVDRFLTIELKSYAEIDLADLLRFHRESRNSVTEARDARGRLGVSLLDRPGLRTTSRKREAVRVPTGGGQAPYEFSGYAKRILAATERQELVRDALTGACAMRPSGKQIREQVWTGEGAILADSVRVIGPTYIGDRTVIRAGATIGPFASVERDCVVDCGTTIEQCTVLPHTYVAPGLLVRRALVDGGRLEDLRSGIVADLEPAGLGRRMEQQDRKASELLADFFLRPGNSREWGYAPSAASSAPTPWLQVEL